MQTNCCGDYRANDDKNRSIHWIGVRIVKLDVEVVKRILSFIEIKHDGTTPLRIKPSDVETDWQSFTYHFELLLQEKFLQGESLVGKNVQINDAVSYGLTWNGHSFLGDSRKAPVWETAKHAASDVSIRTFTNVLTNISTQYCMSIAKKFFAANF